MLPPSAISQAGTGRAGRTVEPINSGAVRRAMLAAAAAREKRKSPTQTNAEVVFSKQRTARTEQQGSAMSTFDLLSRHVPVAPSLPTKHHADDLPRKFSGSFHL